MKENRPANDYFFLPGIHEDPILYTLDSLIFQNNKDSVFLFATENESKVSDFKKSIFNALLLSFKSRIDVRDSTLFLLVQGYAASDSIHAFIRHRALLDYKFAFEPTTCDMSPLIEFLESDKITNYYKAEIEQKNAVLVMRKLDNLRAVSDNLEKAIAYLSIYPKITTLHFNVYLMMASTHNTLRQKDAALAYCKKLLDFDSYVFEPDDQMKAKVHNYTGQIYRFNADRAGLIQEIGNAENLALKDSCSMAFHELMFNKMLLYMGRKTQLERDSFDDLFIRVQFIESQCHHLLANFDLLKGLHLSRIGNNKEAISCLEKAVQFERNKIHPNSALESIAINALYEIFINEKSFDKAIESVLHDAEYKSDYEINDFVSHVHNNAIFPFHFLINLAEVHYEKYKYTGLSTALNEAMFCIDIVNRYIYEQYDVTDEDAIIKFFDDEGNRFFDLALKIQYEAWLKTGNKKYQKNFIALSDRHNNIVLARDLKLKNLNHRLPDSIQQLELRLIQAVKNYKRYRKTTSSYDNAPLEYASFQTRIRNEYPEYQTGAMEKDTIDLGELMHNLGKTKSSILKFDFSDEQIYVTIITGDDFEIFEIDYTKALKTSLEEVSEILTHNLEIVPGKYAEITYNIVNQLLPEAKRKKLTDKIIFIPTGIFYKLNIEALVLHPAATVATFQELSYWGKNAEIVYCPGLTYLKNNLVPSLSKDLKIAAFSFVGKNEKSNSFGHLANIKGTYTEISSLENRFKASQIYSGKKATLGNFKHLKNHETWDILHLGLHGLSESNVRDDVKLYFRKGNSIDSLAGYELMNMDINTSLVILSACQSASGFIHKSEGVYSLSRYFMISNVPNIIASVWDLDDVTSASVFSDFYRLSDISAIRTGSGLYQIKRGLSKKPLHPHYIFGLIRYSVVY